MKVGGVWLVTEEAVRDSKLKEQLRPWFDRMIVNRKLVAQAVEREIKRSEGIGGNHAQAYR